MEAIRNWVTNFKELSDFLHSLSSPAQCKLFAKLGDKSYLLELAFEDDSIRIERAEEINKEGNKREIDIYDALTILETIMKENIPIIVDILPKEAERVKMLIEVPEEFKKDIYESIGEIIDQQEVSIKSVRVRGIEKKFPLGTGSILELYIEVSGEIKDPKIFKNALKRKLRERGIVSVIKEMQLG